MGKKGKTYALLVVVLSIWGIIGYRIFNTINPSNTVAAKDISQVTFNPKKIKKRDTFSINASYRDPFLGTLTLTKKPNSNKKKVRPKIVVTKKNITYTGFIADKTTNPSVFFITIDQQQQMMSINDTFRDVKLIQGTKTKIKIKDNDTTKVIPLSQ